MNLNLTPEFGPSPCLLSKPLNARTGSHFVLALVHTMRAEASKHNMMREKRLVFPADRWKYEEEARIQEKIFTKGS